MSKPARKRLIVGNWKLYKTLRESTDLATALVRSLGAEKPDLEIAIAPVFTARCGR